MTRWRLALTCAALIVGSVQSARGDARIIVASQDDGSLAEIDPRSDTLVARIPVGRGPAGVAVSSDGREIYLSHPDAAIVDVVDVASGRVVRTLPIKGEPFGIASDAGAIYVADWENNRVTRFDGVTGAMRGNVEVGRSPAGITIDAIHRRLYAADRESGDVAVVDTDAMRLVGRVQTGASPYALALSPDGAKLYVANVRSNDLAVIDTVSLQRLATIPVGAMPYGVAVTPDGASVLVTNQHANTLSILDAVSLKIVGAVPVGRYPEGVIAGTNGRAYVANWFSGDVSVIDLAGRRELRRIKVGDGPRNVARLSERSP